MTAANGVAGRGTGGTNSGRGSYGCPVKGIQVFLLEDKSLDL